MLPKVIDCDDLSILTKEHMPLFLQVLGNNRFAMHIQSLFKLVDSYQIDSWEIFCELCNRTDGKGLDLSTLDQRAARDLLAGFSKLLREASFETEVLEALFRQAYSADILQRS